ncbi:Zeatin O-xylosyltransferase [Capsicum annuum]|nr:Zeatin O-xylosyltransferase [Capsicum annuum]
MPSLEGCSPDEIMHAGRLQSPYTSIKAGDIYNTSQVIEGSTFLDLLAQLVSILNKKQWAIGPILPTKHLDQISNRDNICLNWLDKQPPNSVLYVSFGTLTSFSDEQIKELAMGLERSKQKFMWVLRDADEGVLFTGESRTERLELPEGVEERVKGVGLVIRDWAPQPEILAHLSTATHNLQVRVGANALNPSDIDNIVTPEFTSAAPDPNALSKFLAQLMTSYAASSLLCEPIALFLKYISFELRQVVVVHDV